MRCPGPADLLLSALDPEAGSLSDSIERHVRDCVSCRRNLESLRQIVTALRFSAPVGQGAATDCLDDATITDIAEGNIRGRRSEIVVHLAACSSCREQVASMALVLGDPLVRAEIDRLAAVSPISRGRRRTASIGTLIGLLAACLAGVIFWPSPAADHQHAGPREPVERERLVDMAAAPRIVSPRGGALASDDSLRWTSVAQADLYRVTVFDTTGTVVWEGEARDTIVALPDTLRRALEYLWKIEARTGWGRWVASEELATFTLPARQ
jgi:hypothetical protein